MGPHSRIVRLGTANRMALGEGTMSGREEDNDRMKHEYDFSQGERGKFYRPGMTLRLPVHLEEPLQEYLSAAAERKGRSLTELVNDLLRKEVAIVETIK